MRIHNSGAAHGAEVFFVVAVVIFLVVTLGGEGEAHGAGRKVVYFTPEHRRKVKTIIRAVEMEALFIFAVVNDDIKAARHRNQKLMAAFQSMSRSICAARHVIKVKDALDGEGNVAIGFEKSQIAPRILDLREFDNAALREFYS